MCIIWHVGCTDNILFVNQSNSVVHVKQCGLEIHIYDFNKCTPSFIQRIKRIAQTMTRH